MIIITVTLQINFFPQAYIAAMGGALMNDVDPDLDTDPVGSGRIRIHLGPWIRIRIPNTDPDPQV